MPDQNRKTVILIEKIEEALDQSPPRLNSLYKKFINTFLIYVEEIYILEFSDEKENDDIIKENIDKTLPLRDDFIKFVEFICASGIDNNKLDILIEFFEELSKYTGPPKGIKSYKKYQWDHIKFFVHELFLYCILILLEHKKYKSIYELLNTEYFLYKPYGTGRINSDYIEFRNYLPSLDKLRNKRLELNKISVTAKILVERADESKFSRKKLTDIDLLLYYLSILYENEKEYRKLWFPVTFIYGEYKYASNKIIFLQKLISKRYFNNVKVLFNVQNCEELKTKIHNFVNSYENGYSKGFETISDIKQHINPDEICTST